eukprot:CAMPEP_0167760750 /NCGR_PEP_ID=MMETSP0110_2-20121227/11760_1 /TAXON_ID=629695 /ORGANISM="Gymnochlora sp., Strain CCMP2014" /LENGTH=390 /DNA_ID=CAMNT_0007647297 /DNA_START=67 /DNA_END=1235 /DNA_ORIENTATION=+
MKELTETINQGAKSMKSIGIFKNNSIAVVVNKSGTRLSPDITIVAEEKKPYFISAGVSHHTQSKNLALKLHGIRRNIFGNGETLTTAISYGQADAGSLNIIFQKPKFMKSKAPHTPDFGTLDASLEYSGGTKFSSFIEKVAGMKFQVRSDDNRNYFRYGCVWRDTLPLTEKDKPPSNSVLEASKPSLKSYLSYTFLNDSTDHSLVPTKGFYLKGDAEFAGIGGDVSHVKLESCGRKYFALSKSISCGIGAFAGLLVPTKDFKPFGAASYINDRFFLQGTRDLKVRGFKEFGPMDEGDALGGDTYFALGAHMSYCPPIKAFEDYNIRLHAFTNCGNMTLLNDGSDVADRMSSMFELEGLKVSVGCGIVAPTPFGRFEFNLAKPVNGNLGDV